MRDTYFERAQAKAYIIFRQLRLQLCRWEGSVRSGALAPGIKGGCTIIKRVIRVWHAAWWQQQNSQRSFQLGTECFHPLLTHFLLRREGFTALHAAAKSGHLHVVQFLVSEGADVNAVALDRDECYHTVLKEAMDENTTRHIATAEYLRGVGAREHCLHGAVQEGNIALIRDILLEHPDFVNKPLSETFRQEPFAFAVCIPHPFL